MTPTDALARLAEGPMTPQTFAWTAHHSRDVALLARRVAPILGLDPDRLALAALLHDIGKATVPDSLLTKPGPLTPAERAVVRRHSADGARMLEAVPELADLAPVVRSVHERWDGAGYPDGLWGEAIPLEARAIACCDTYDALVSDRPYRSAVCHEAAIGELTACAGGQLDPRCVRVALDVFPA